MSVLLSETIRLTLDGMTKFRKALPTGPCDDYENSDSNPPGSSNLKRHLEEAMSTIQSHVTPELLEQNLRAKYEMHNKHAEEHRARQISTMAHQSKKRKSSDEVNECVGYIVASCLTLHSVIRASTPEERNSISMEEGRLRGLTVREETFSTLMKILGKLKSDPALMIAVKDLRGLVDAGEEGTMNGLAMVCDFTLISFARCCVELGALAVVH